MAVLGVRQDVARSQLVICLSVRENVFASAVKDSRPGLPCFRVVHSTVEEFCEQLKRDNYVWKGRKTSSVVTGACSRLVEPRNAFSVGA